jgi:hypothetical protein
MFEDGTYTENHMTPTGTATGTERSKAAVKKQIVQFDLYRFSVSNRISKSLYFFALVQIGSNRGGNI